MEGKRSGDVGGEVRGIVAAGIDVKFMRDFAAGENFVERGGAGIESIVVLVTAIEVNLQA